MIIRRIFLPLLLVGVLAAGCTTSSLGPKQGAGTVGGAVLGGLAGSQFGGGGGQLAATAAGTLIGAFVGSEIGTSLDRADQAHAQQAANDAFETGRTGSTTSWQNPDSGNAGMVQPQQVVGYNNGQPCRAFEQTIFVDGRAETVSGTACRNPDGTWTVLN